MKRAAITLASLMALAGCTVEPSEPIAFIGIGDAGAACSTAAGEAVCSESAPTCEKMGDCCQADVAGGCLSVCEPCCITDGGAAGDQGFRCVAPGP